MINYLKIPIIRAAHFSTASGISIEQSTSSMFSCRTKCDRHCARRLAFIAHPTGPKSYSPATPEHGYME